MSSPPHTLPEFIIHVTAVTVCLEQAERSKRLRSGKLRIGPHKHRLICGDNGSLCQQFFSETELTSVTRITLRYKASFWPQSKEIQINTANLLTGVPTSQAEGFKLSASHDGIRVEFSCQNATTVQAKPENTENETHTTSTGGNLTPTTHAIFEDRPQFRILVIGKSGVGKSTLIRTAFGIDAAYSSDFERGIANIEAGLQSPVNERFILHDSLGFEAADNVNYDTVKKFIQGRRTCAPKDRLHAVWFCVPVPQAGSRLLEASAEDFFKTKEETMGTIPIIMVYTKADKFMNDWLLKSASSHQEHDDDHLTELAFSEVKSHVKGKHEEIDRFTGESLPYAVVSSKEKYKYTLQGLIELTSTQVGVLDTPEAQIASGVITLIAAQRIDPNLKIKGTIDVGRQKYWNAIGSSPAFKGHSISDCLSVIHTDIVNVWNFNDPACYLSEKVFKDLVASMAEKMEISPVSSPTQRILALSGGSLVAVVSAILGSVANPAAPIVLPILAGVTLGVWLYGVYENAKNVQRLFIAYIVDLTHILETLAVLNARDHKKLTRRIIKLAYHTYHDSGLMGQAHGNIQRYRQLKGQDTALELIEDSIRPERYGDASLRNYYAGVSKLDLAKFHLEEEEEW